jgi:hypothetical protein
MPELWELARRSSEFSARGSFFAKFHKAENPTFAVWIHQNSC